MNSQSNGTSNSQLYLSNKTKETQSTAMKISNLYKKGIPLQKKINPIDSLAGKSKTQFNFSIIKKNSNGNLKIRSSISFMKIIVNSDLETFKIEGSSIESSKSVKNNPKLTFIISNKCKVKTKFA